MTDLTRTLARYVAHSRYDELPAHVRHEGVRAFVNWVGCAAGGCREDNVQRALSLLMEFNGAAQATIVGRHEKLDALNATFINSMSSGALVFNDTHYATVAHPTSPVAAALLALAECNPMSGQDFVHALILGDEIQCRVGNMLCVPPATCEVGWSMAGLVSGIGAAVAAAKVLGLDEHGIVTAIGHAANQAGGLREAHGSMASQYTPGHAARCGLMAALLAQRGFTCSPTMLEGPNGYARAFVRQPNFDAAVEKLGDTFEIALLAYKPYPCGFVIHPVIDACLEIAEKKLCNADTVARIELTVNPLAVQLCDRPNPRNANQALVSLQHWAAASLLCKSAGVAQLAEAVLHDPALSALRGRIVMNSDAGVGREAACARVVFNDGTHTDASIMHCRGSVGRPMTDEDVSEKTRGQLMTVFSIDTTQHLLDECWRIEAYPQVGALCRLLEAK